MRKIKHAPKVHIESKRHAPSKRNIYFINIAGKRYKIATPFLSKEVQL